MVATDLSPLRRSFLALAVIAATVLAAGCDDSPTAPAADTTPPPIPAQVSPAEQRFAEGEALFTGMKVLDQAPCEMVRFEARCRCVNSSWSTSMPWRCRTGFTPS